jgi:hypothetical protein
MRRSTRTIRVNMFLEFLQSCIHIADAPFAVLLLCRPAGRLWCGTWQALTCFMRAAAGVDHNEQQIRSSCHAGLPGVCQCTAAASTEASCSHEASSSSSSREACSTDRYAPCLYRTSYSVCTVYTSVAVADCASQAAVSQSSMSLNGGCDPLASSLSG